MGTAKEFTGSAAISLCTGMRGLDRGLEAIVQDVRTLAYVEIEAFVVSNLVAQMEKGVLAPTPIWTNLKTFNARGFRGMVDILLGGYPCQPFSAAGPRKGEKDPRHLWPHIRRIIMECQPLCCFFENVDGHLSLGYETVRGELQEMGYHVEEGIYSAQEVGASHRRKRLFIFAVDYTRCFGHDNPQNKIQAGWLRAILSGERDVANTDSVWERESQGEFTDQRGWVEHSSQQAGDVANAEQSRLQGYSGDELNGEWRGEGWQKKDRPTTPPRVPHWPAPPGAHQYDWESPRAISVTAESDLGLAAHGYRFRTDLLRMAGNAVVWQQAAFALTHLLKKHKLYYAPNYH